MHLVSDFHALNAPTPVELWRKLLLKSNEESLIISLHANAYVGRRFLIEHPRDSLFDVGAINNTTKMFFLLGKYF